MVIFPVSNGTFSSVAILQISNVGICRYVPTEMTFLSLSILLNPTPHEKLLTSHKVLLIIW